MIRIKIEKEPSVTLKASVDKPIPMRVRVDYMTRSDDYNNLINLPTLNGKTIIGDMVEEDPTVPEWAKEKDKPQYSADEINAVGADDSISIEYLASLFA